MGLIDKVINIKVIADKTIVIVVVKGRGRFARGEANQNNLCSGGREGEGVLLTMREEQKIHSILVAKVFVAVYVNQ